MTELEVLITRGRNKWTLKITNSDAFSLTATFRPEEPGSLAFERTGHRAIACAERIVGSNVPFTFTGLAPHPDAR